MCDYPFFIPQVVLFANSSLFWFKVTNEHREFRNYLFNYRNGTMNIQKNLYLILTSVLSIIKRKASFHKRPLFFSSYIFYLRTARRYTTRETAAEMTSVIQKACHTKTPPPRWDSR